MINNDFLQRAPVPAPSGGAPAVNPSDAFKLGLNIADTNAAETDAMSLALTFPESNAALTEALSLKIGFSDLTPAQQDALLSLGITFTDSVAAQSDAATFLLKATYADTIPKMQNVIGGGTNVPDSSGNGRDGTLQGTNLPTSIASPWTGFGSALLFDGTGTTAATACAVRLPAPSWAAGQPFTFKAKVRRDRLAMDEIFLGGFDGTLGDGLYLLYFGSDDLLHFQLLDSGGTQQFLASLGTVPVGTHEVEADYDGTTLSLYLDGTRQGTLAIASHALAASVNFYLGADGRPTAPGLFKGALDEAHISTVARHTGASYVVPTVPDTADANTWGLYHLDGGLIGDGDTLTLNIKGLGDTNVAATDSRKMSVRCWATGCTSNDATTGNTVAPGNANGQKDGVFANCKTGTGTADTQNPVTITTGSMNVVGSLTILAARIRVYFKLGAILAAVADSISITYSTGGGPAGTFWQGPALATVAYGGEDYGATGRTLDVSSFTLAQLQALQLVASYNAGIVLAPQSALLIDAWAVEIDAVI